MSDTRSPLRHIQGALGWSFAGLLLTYGLINFIGFISPFWAAWQYPDSQFASFKLLHAWQPITPWFSLCFLVAGWHLAMAMRSLPARAVVFAAYTMVPAAMIGMSIAKRTIVDANTPVPPQVPAVFSMVAQMYLTSAWIAFFALAWWTLRRINQSSVTS